MSPAPGHQTSVAALPRGFAVNAEPPPAWRHPWWVTPRWTGGTWVATVKPGTVNGRVPAVRTWIKQQEQWGNFGTNPLSGQRYFSAEIFAQGKAVIEETPIDIPLYRSPLIELRLRPMGVGGAPEDVVPPYFLDLGVRQRRSAEDLLAAVERGQNPLARQRGERLLYAADLILRQPRAGLNIEVTIQPDFNGVSNVTQRLTITPPDFNDALRVFSGIFEPDPPRIDPLNQVYTEPNYDDRRIATVFLLSPPDAQGTPDGTWLPFVKPDLFWPLNYSAPPPLRPRQLSSGALAVPLVGGLAQPIVNFFTAAAGDAADMALNWVQAQSNRGRWWTPTGGGSDAEFPDEPEQLVQPSGLGRAVRIAASREQALRQQAAARRKNALSPRFPYRAVPYSAAA